MADKRRAVVSVRLTLTEHDHWARAASASPWAALAHWVREVVTATANRTRPGARPGAVARLAPVPNEWLLRLSEVCDGLNDGVKASNTIGICLPDAIDSLERVVEVVTSFSGYEVEAIDHPVHALGSTMVDRSSVRPRLVNIRLSGDELDQWGMFAEQDGYSRVSSWVRELVNGLVGIEVLPRPKPIVSPERKEAARQIGGAITNAAQLSYLNPPESALRRIEAAHGQLQDAVLVLKRGWT